MKKLVVAGFALASILGMALPAAAQFPEKPIHIIAGFAPGGATDVAARLISNRMGRELGQQVLVENRAGDSTNIAAVYVRNSTPDGYTLFIAGNSNSVNPALRDDVPIDILNDFKPIAPWAQVPNILVVHPSLGVDTLEGLLEVARNTPDGLFFGSSGVGAISHLSGEYLANRAGVQLSHIPYQGSAAAMTDLLAGEIQMMFAARSTVEQYISDGSLVAIASTTKTRPAGLEDLPTVSEAGIEGFDANIWFGIVAPAGTPDDVVEVLRAAVEASLADEALLAQLADQGIEPFAGDGAAYWAYMESEMEKWAEIVTDANIGTD